MQGLHVFDPRAVVAVDLESLVHDDHLLRKVDRILETSFTRELTAACYASGVGRPSIDPEVFFRMLLVAYLYDIKSDRQLCEDVHHNFAYRWFCRLSLQDRVPDHSSVNQRAYPQPICQKPGLGFPLVRIAAVISLAFGAVLDVGICRYAGKGQSELGMLRTLWSLFLPGDVMLADRLMCTWTEMVMLKQRGVDCVCRLTSHRTADFRRGNRLGKHDHIVKWLKPAKPRSIDRETYDALLEFLMIRECRVQVGQPGFRIRTLIVATTLLDAVAFTRDDLAQLYRARWNAELDLRSLKQTLQMDVLRCKTPELVRKERWTHILAYNLIRTITAQAAIKHGIEPRTISFKGAVQTLEAFQPVIALQGEHDPALRKILYEHLLDAIATHRVADRPDRSEPRRRKRRPKPYDRLMKPRWKAKRDLQNGLRKNY